MKYYTSDFLLHILFFQPLCNDKNREKEGNFIKTCIFFSECFAVSKKGSIFALAFGNEDNHNKLVW